MKKKLGALVLALVSLALSAACASSGSDSWPQQPGDEATDVVGARQSTLPGQPENTADVQTEAAP